MTRAAGKRKDSSGDERVAVDGNVIRKAEKSAPRCFYVRFVLMTRLLMFALLQSLAQFWMLRTFNNYRMLSGLILAVAKTNRQSSSMRLQIWMATACLTQSS